MLDVIQRHESSVRSYVRSFPKVFAKSKGSTIETAEGKAYLDFFAGAGALNYGHNNPILKESLITYLQRDGIVHSLDMATEAKIELLETFEELILKPRSLEYKIQFPGPTGTNAVESAIKLARKVTGRQGVISFTNGFHGMTLGALSVTGNTSKRKGAGVALSNVQFMPFASYLGEEADTLDYMRSFLVDNSSGVDMPAAMILETVQAEGGVNVASPTWLKGLSELAKELGVLLIVDDIQVGCGRTGPFFSFERAGIQPDIVTLSKSISGYGLPMALVLMKPELDVWEAGEHNGTFRGFNPGFVTAKKALETYWSDNDFHKQVDKKAELVSERLQALVESLPALNGEVRGLGMIQGIDCKDSSTPAELSRRCFEKGLIIETAGPDNNVLKLLPPLTTTTEELERGLDIIQSAAEEFVAEGQSASA